MDCVTADHAADARTLEAELREIEALAMARGLGPILDQVRQEYLALRAISSSVCVPTTPAVLASAHGALADFRAWVIAQPARRRARPTPIDPFWF